MRRPVVAVFRQRLFAPSETFIPVQVEALSQFRGHYISRLPLSGHAGSQIAISLADTHSLLEDRLFAMTGYSSALTRTLRDTGADIIHAHFGPDGMLVAPTATKLSIPLVVTLHGRDAAVHRSQLIKSRKPVAIRYAFSKGALSRKAGRIICVSEHLRQTAVKGGFPEDKLTTHYIGVDTEKFPVSHFPRTERLLHVARLVEKKGTANLITAFSRISRRYPDAYLDIVGDGPLGDALKEQTRQLGVDRRVIFHGTMPHTRVKQLLSTAHAFVLPSVTAANGDREGLPISILEAMSSGTPVISTFHSGIPEVIPSDAYGLLVEEHDVEGLTERLEAVLQDQAYAEGLGMAGARRVREHFNLTEQSRALEKIYEELLT